MFKGTLLTLTICVAASLTNSQPTYAQFREFKILPTDGGAIDYFGGSVSISGDYAVVGASGDGSGSAYVFKRTGTTWTQEAKLHPSDGARSDAFGVSVSISADDAVVGASYDDDNGFSSGSAYVFKRSGTSWVQESKLLPFDGAVNDLFGRSVSISGDYAVVGAYLDNDNGSFSGSAYVFKRTGTSWAQEAKLLPSDGAADDEFGFSVSISGDYAVVGAAGHDDNGFSSGSAYVFKRTGTSWAQEAKLLASDGAPFERFGSSVSISGDCALVGASYDGDNGTRSGSAYVFKRTGTIWVEEAKLLPSDGAASDYFGTSVSVSGDYAVVGAYEDDDNGFSSGSAYVFKRTGTSWAQEAKLLASDGAVYDFFGYSVSVSGGHAVVGASGHDDNGDDAGSAYLYDGFISSGFLTVSIPESFGDAGDTLWVPINALETDNLEIISSEFTLAYDTLFTNILDINFQQTLPDSAGWSIEHNLEPGSLHVAMSGDVPISGSGALSYVQFAVREDAAVGSGTPLILSPFLFNEGDPIANILNGSLSVGAPAILLFPDALSFGWIEIGEVVNDSFRIENTGTTDLDIFSVSWMDNAFNVDVGDVPTTLPSGLHLDLVVTFSPLIKKFYSDRVVVSSNAGEASVRLEGNGIIVGVETEQYDMMPTNYILYQNAPNPFNPTTIIKYSLPVKSKVLLSVYNMLGEEVIRLAAGYRTAGYHQVTWDASNVPSGMYFYRLQSGDFVLTRKMVLLK